jgi:hypothetical protein
MHCPAPLLLLAAIVGALIAAASPALAVGDPLPANSCRRGTPACPNGCCTSWCPNGSAGDAITKAVPGLQTKIVGLTYSKSKLLLTGTIVVTNTGKKPIASVYTGVMAGSGPTGDVEQTGQDNMFCGGASGKPIAPGASRSCPFAIVGGLDNSKQPLYGWQPTQSALPGVKPATWQEARAFTTSDVVQTDVLTSASQPFAYPKVRDTQLYPQPGFPGFICGFASVRAKVVA